MDEKLLNRIISVAYGDASFIEKLKIYSLAKKNSEVKNLLEEYKRTANQTHSIKLENLSEEVIENIKNVTNTKHYQENSIFNDFYSFVFRRPVFTSAIAVMIILAMVSTFIVKRPEIHQQYTQQEIENADKQVKHSLALIAGVFKKTSLTVEKDVLTDRVSIPIKESFNLVNEYLQGDNKNEKVN
ncbi:MAG: hypothetical protein H6612_03555 [Ignavibacteriales bacterium]|nr:hypothetical protein [Ignavibacteriales bacterium]MCB9258406.1 hypothetical protein [Ignavibacteriales bacterium]